MGNDILERDIPLYLKLFDVWIYREHSYLIISKPLEDIFTLSVNNEPIFLKLLPLSELFVFNQIY